MESNQPNNLTNHLLMLQCFLCWEISSWPTDTIPVKNSLFYRLWNFVFKGSNNRPKLRGPDRYRYGPHLIERMHHLPWYPLLLQGNDLSCYTFGYIQVIGHCTSLSVCQICLRPQYGSDQCRRVPQSVMHYCWHHSFGVYVVCFYLLTITKQWLSLVFIDSFLAIITVLTTLNYSCCSTVQTNDK